MDPSGARNWRYKVICPQPVLDELRELDRRARQDKVGEAFLSALKTLQERLEGEPMDFGEPLYRLRELRLQVRMGVIPPLAVDYAVHEERPLVFIKRVRELPGPHLF